MQSVVTMTRRSLDIYMSPFPRIALPTSTSTASAVNRILFGSVQIGASARHCFGSNFPKWLNGPNSSSRADGSQCPCPPPFGVRGEYLSRDCTVMVHRNSYVTTRLKHLRSHECVDHDTQSDHMWNPVSRTSAFAQRV